MKKKLWIITAIVLLCGIVFAAAASAEGESLGQEMTIDGYKVLIVDDKARILERVEPLSGDVEIPDTLEYESKTYQVTGIEANAFASIILCKNVATVTIPVSISYIGEGAFVGCASLETITIDAGNQDFVVENGILFNKDKTTLITYPAGLVNETYVVPNSITNIANGAFCWNVNLESVTIPGTVTTIGNSAFEQCAFLEEVTIVEGVTPTTIGSSAFEGCASLVSVTLPKNVSVIGNYAFFDCESLVSVTILNDEIDIQYDKSENEESVFAGSLEGVTLYGNKGSAAETYVGKFNTISFRVIGYTISGKITAAAAGDVTITLLDESKEEVAKDTVTITEAGKAAEYSITVEEAGEYTLRVSMPKHVTREYTVFVGGED